ncbi:MAG TPA: hypothetical protein PKE31_09815 [Pseudomonadota bacterium]|nr:hypothetical protein [Pseudomonadota bacterium]
MVPVSDPSSCLSLAPLDIEDAAHFFGRARKTNRLRELLSEKKIVTLVGPCGSGKTSLLRAGLCASLRAEQEDEVAVFGVEHPALDPFGELSTQGLVSPADDLALAVRSVTRSGKRVLLFFDHLEELLFAEPFARQHVVEQLEALAHSIREGTPAQLVLSVVPDALSGLSVLAKGLSGLLEEQTLWLPHLLEVSEWTEMVHGPARDAGLHIEDGFLTALGKDMEAFAAAASSGQRVGAVLPLLSGLFQRAQQIAQLGPRPKVLTEEDYHSTGGLLRALPDWAETRFRNQPPPLQTVFRRALLSLVYRQRLAEGEVLFSRPRKRSDLLSLVSSERNADRSAVLETEAVNRLLTAGLLTENPKTDILELAHGCLLSAWPELARWPEEERRFELWHGEMLALAAREGSGVSQNGIPQSQPALFGMRLGDAERYLVERPLQVDARVARFIKSNLYAQPRRPAPVVSSSRRRFLPWIIAACLLVVLVGLLIEQQRLSGLSMEHADKMAAEQGARAALLVQQPGQDGAALALAISAVAPSLRSGLRVPVAAKEGLMLTYSTAKNSLPLVGHKDRIEVVSFDPTGEVLITGSRDQTARLWNARTGRLLRELRGHNGFLTAAAFSPDGRRALTASSDGTARLWEAETGEPLVTMRGHGDPIEMASFSLRGDRLVTAGQDHTIRIWDVATGVELRVLRGHSERVPMAVFAPSGKSIVSVSFDKTVRVWDAETGKELRSFAGHRHRVNIVAVSPDGQRAATGSWDGTVRLWGIEPGTSLPETGVEMQQGTPLHSLQFSQDGSLIASAGADGEVKLWDGRTGEPRGTLHGHQGIVDALSFTSDGKVLVTAGHDRMVRIWSVASRLEITVLRGHFGPIYAVAVSGKGDKVATVSHDRTARIWDLRSGQPLLVLSGHSRYISASAFSPDGTRIATASHDHTAKLWKWPSGEEVATLVGHEHVINSITFSSDGMRIATGSSDGTVRVFDGQTGNKLALLRGHKDAVQTVTFAPDGRRLLSAGSDETLRLWDTERQLLLQVGKHSLGTIMQATFSSDGQVLATASSDGGAVLRDGNTLAEKRVLVTSGQVISSAVFFPTAQGLKLITAAERMVSKWDVAGGQQQVLLTLPNPVQMAALSPTGEHLLVVGTDNSLLLWDMAAEMPLWRWPSMPFELSDANFAAPDGRYFLLSTADGKTLIYPDEYRSNLSGTLTDACNLLRYRPEFQTVSTYCP